MNCENLTYDEIIERSRKYITRIYKGMFIYGIIATFIMFGFILFLTKDLLMASVISSIILVFILIVYPSVRRACKYGIDKDICEYKDEINEYNVVYGDFQYILTKKHLIAFQHDDTMYMRIIALDEIETFTTKNYLKDKKSYFAFKLVNGKKVIVYLPNVFIELLYKYKNN